MKNLLSIIFIAFFCQINAQVNADKKVGKKNQQLVDSLKVSEYEYSLPIWGKKATQAGFDLPYSAGLSINTFGQKSDILISNLMVGFNNGPMYNLDELVRFDLAKSQSSSITVRPDIWLFPFLNVYGILGKTNASTEVGFGVWLPNPVTNTETELLSLKSKVDFDATSFGIGMTPTIGVGGGFLALDMNVVWTDVPQLEKSAMTFVFGPRLGKSFSFKKPERSVAFWVGGFRVHLKSETAGSLNLAEVLPVDELAVKVANGYQKVDVAQQELETWWDNLSLAQQANPVNKAKYELGNRTLETAGNMLSAADAAISSGNNASVQYAIDKRPKEKWNFIVGSQFQLNKHFMLRVEGGFLGSRVQFTSGLQYRFGL